MATGEEVLSGLMHSNDMHLASFQGKKVTIPIDEQLCKDEQLKRAAGSRRKADTTAVFADTQGTYGGAK